MRALMYGGLATAIVILAIGAVQLGSPSALDYAAAPEKAQQAILDEMAAGLQYGLVRSTGGAVAVHKSVGDAATDSLWVYAQFVDRRYEAATEEQAELVREALFQNNCNQHTTRTVIEDGVAIRFAIGKPSGAPLIDVQFDRASCAPFLRAAVG